MSHTLRVAVGELPTHAGRSALDAVNAEAARCAVGPETAHPGGADGKLARAGVRIERLAGPAEHTPLGRPSGPLWANLSPGGQAQRPVPGGRKNEQHS